MLKMTPLQFAQRIKSQNQGIKRLLERQLPIIIGKEAVNHFKLNFQNEGWERTKWPEVKRRTEPWARGAARTRKILTGETGDLGRSIQYTPGKEEVTIHSDVVYADVHNSGLKAGRGKGFIMPKRQFIGESEALNVKIREKVDEKINKILQK